MNDAQLYLKIALFSQVISSVVFIGALVFMWFRWILPVVMAAQKRSNRRIAEAERHRDEVKGALEALRDEIQTAHHDAHLIEQRVAARVEHEREATVLEAREAGERAVADAALEIDRARAAARVRLRDDVVEAALRIARDDAQRRVGPATDARFVDELTGSLGEAAHG